MKLDLPGTTKAIEIYKEIIEEQPNFVPPYLEINQGYTYLGAMGRIPAGEAFVKAKPFLDKAIELDENYPECQLNLSWTACWQNWDLPAAYEHIDKAIDNRHSDQMYLTRSNFLTIQGKLEEATRELNKALQIAPIHPMNVHYQGFLHYLKEEYEEAIPYFKKSLELQPGLHYPIVYQGCALILNGQPDQALEFFQALPDPNPGDLTKVGGTTLAHAALGNKSKVEEGIRSLEAMLQTETMGSALNFLIQCHTILGNYDKAMELIEQGLQFRLSLILLMYTEPLMKPLRTNARFMEIMNEALGLGDQLKTPKRKYKQALFEKAELDNYKLQLEHIMVEETPYLEPGLSLRDLAEMINLPPNHMSQLLNEGFDKNFAEFVNTYRIETFKTKVADPTLRHLTILALAYESGFNSKTVFNTFFKKMTGKTPKAFWKEVVDG